jgi:ribosomal protein S27AE
MANTSDQKASGKMICPRCGAGMNHHCDKPVYGASPHELTEHDPDNVELLSGGLITQFHSCPNCGAAAFRNA